MRVWLGLLVAAAICAPGAMGQEAVDVGDPSVTKRPMFDPAGGGPEYPPVARRNGQHGESKVSTCVDSTGKAHDARLVSSSGHTALDDAAVGWLNGAARFKPAETDGKPVAVCNYTFTYVWKLPGGAHPPSAAAGYEEASAMRTEDLPVVLSRPALPPYPPGALARRSSGTVRMSFCIGPTGALSEFTVVEGYADMDLVIGAMPWFVGTTYKPGQKGGKPVGVCGVEDEFTWQLPTVQLPSATL